MARRIHEIESISLHTLPDVSGIYIFKSNNGEVLYVGKAKNLNNRVKSYFNLNLETKTMRMVKESKIIETITVNSEFEAILLEAKLINSLKPKYNIELKDDKSPIYIGITNDKYPIVKAVRKTNLYEVKFYWGPYLSFKETKTLLKTIREVLPFSDHKISKTACIYNQIGLCNPCPNLIEKTLNLKIKKDLSKMYLKNIKRVRATLDGRLKKVKKGLISEMDKFSKNQEYEKAKEIRNQLILFNNLTTKKFLNFNYIENPNLMEDIIRNELNDLKKVLKSHGIVTKRLNRIECFDVSHLTGTSPAASMVVFTKGLADKSSYKRFKIKSENSKSDTDSIKEVILRRVSHISDLSRNSSWGTPDLIIVDGGKPQVKAAVDALKGVVPIIGIAKRYETLVFMNEGRFSEYRLTGPALNFVQKIRDEAHRFARAYHHKLVELLIKNVK